MDWSQSCGSDGFCATSLSAMTQTQSLRIAAWAYVVLGVIFALMLVAGPSLTDRVPTSGQRVSLMVFTAVALALGAWAWRIQRGSAKLNSAFFISSFGAGPVIGVAFGGITFALMYGIPFFFVALAWRKAEKTAAAHTRNDR